MKHSEECTNNLYHHDMTVNNNFMSSDANVNSTMDASSLDNSTYDENRIVGNGSRKRKFSYS